MYPCLSRSPYRESFYNPPATPAASPTPSRVHYFPVSAKNSNSSTSDEGKPSSSPSSKSQYLDPYESRSGSPIFSNRSSIKKGLATTPTSPMVVKLFNSKLNDYNNSREALNCLSKTNSHQDDEYSRPSSSNASVGSHFLSPYISPCQSPAIRNFRKKTSPSLINLKSPETSPRTSQVLSPTPYSPSSMTSSTNISPDYNLNISTTSPSPSTNNSSNGSIFSFNTSDTSNQTTPAITPQTPRSPLSISLMNISRRIQRPISPLGMNNPPEGKKKGNPAPPLRKSISVKRHNYSKNI